MKEVTEDRLSANDSVFFVAESASTPQVTALLTLLARTPDLARLKEAALRAVEALPRMRCLLDPRRFGVFVPVSRFDVDSHVTRVHAAEIMETVARLHSEPLAKDRPLWQFILISNRHPETGELPLGAVERAAILWRIHHGLSDGIRSLGVFRTMLGNTPAPVSNGHQQALRGWNRRSLDRAIRAVRIAARTQRMSGVPSPLNGVSSPARRLTPVELDRTVLRAIMRREGVGLHEVTVGILASALRRYHEQRGASTATDLRVIVPSNSRPLPNSGSRGNFVDMLWVKLPISEVDPIRRLRRSAENLTRARDEGWVEFSQVTPPLIARAPLWMQRQCFSKASALTNAVCTIMPVNLHNLEIDGQSIGRSYAAATLLETHGAGFTFITTGATIRGAIVSDPNIVPDPDFLARALEAGLRELSG